MHGLPTAPERVTFGSEQPAVERAGGGEPRSRRTRFDIDGRLVSGTVRDNPVIEVVLKLVAASAPYWHPAAAKAARRRHHRGAARAQGFFAQAVAARASANCRRPAAASRSPSARVQQGEVIAIANGALGLSPAGRLDGQLRLTVANLDKLLPALGLDRMLCAAAGAASRSTSAFGALDRIMPGLGNVARQNAGPAIVAGINLMGQPTELEGKRAVALPLRFDDGEVSLGPLQLGIGAAAVLSSLLVVGRVGPRQRLGRQVGMRRGRNPARANPGRSRRCRGGSRACA